MLIFSVDYDDTYSSEPELFSEIIKLIRARGHVVVIVTARNKDTHPIEDIGVEVFYTNGAEKAAFMREQGLEIDIWMDDWPELIGKTRV